MSTQKRFSKEGFKQLPNIPQTMGNPNDVTIDIPLTTVTSNTGARKPENNVSSNGYGQTPEVAQQKNNEKAGLFHRRVAGRRKVAKSSDEKHMEGEEDTMTQMGIIYDKILNFSIVTRYFLYVLPLALIIATPIIVGATAAEDTKIGGVRIVWFFSWVEIVWLSIWVSKLVARALPWVFQFLCGIVSSGTRKYALVLKALEIPLSLSGWALASLATFLPIMTRNPTNRARQRDFNGRNATSKLTEPLDGGTSVKEWESVVQKVLSALLIASLLFLGEKLLIQLLSIGYHRKQFNAKIKQSKHNIHLMSLLYDASRALFPAYCDEFAEVDYIINDSIDITISKSGTGNKSSESATPMRLLQNVGRVGDKITSAFGNIAQEVTGKQVFNPHSAHSIVVEALEKNKSSEALAKRLWISFVVEGKDALYQEDIAEVLGSERREEANECFACLDRDGNGDVSLDEMILTVCEFGRERHSIANSMHDVDQAIDVLDSLLCTVVLVLCIFVFVGFLSPTSTSTLVTAGTTLLSLSFVFAVSTQEVLGSCIFLFVKHPYDVLDRVDIGDDQLIVEHISLLYTIFKKVSTNKLTQVPNIVLNSLWIQNVSRSKAMKEQLLMWIHFDTTLEDIQLLRNEMQAFVLDPENCRDFQPDIDVEVTGIHEMNKLELRVEIKHKSNWANETVRAARRSKFMCALVLALRKIPIYAPGGGDATLGSSDKPTYSVTVTDVEAAANRDAFAKTKEGKRLVPSKKPDEPQPIKSPAKSTTATDIPDPTDPAMPSPLRYRLPTLDESTALKDLNTRPPAADTAHHRADSADSDLYASGSTTPHEAHRSADLEEVQGLLHRQSTRGKRKTQSSKTGTVAPRIPPLEDFGLNAPRMEVEYSSYPPQTLDPYLPPNLTGYEVQPHSPALGVPPEMQQVPQVPPVRRPVPGSGNAFAQQAKEDRERQQRQREEAVRKEQEREVQ